MRASRDPIPGTPYRTSHGGRGAPPLVSPWAGSWCPVVRFSLLALAFALVAALVAAPWRAPTRGPAPGRRAASCRSRRTPRAAHVAYAATPGGVWRTTDGTTWTRVLAVPARDVAVDATRLVAATDGGRVALDGRRRELVPVDGGLPDDRRPRRPLGGARRRARSTPARSAASSRAPTAASRGRRPARATCRTRRSSRTWRPTSGRPGRWVYAATATGRLRLPGHRHELERVPPARSAAP